MGGKSSKGGGSIWDDAVSPFEEFVKGSKGEGMETDGDNGTLVAYIADKMKSKKMKVNPGDIDKIVAGTPIHDVYPGMGDEMHKALIKSNEKGIQCDPLSPKDTLKVFLDHKGALVNNDWSCIAGVLEEHGDHLATLQVNNTLPYLHSILDGKVEMALQMAQWIQDWACHFTKPTIKKIELYVPDAGGDASTAFYLFTKGQFQVELFPKTGASPAALPTPGGVETGVLKHAEVDIPKGEGKPIVIMCHVTNQNPMPPTSIQGGPQKPTTIKTFALTTTKNWEKSADAEIPKKGSTARPTNHYNKRGRPYATWSKGPRQIQALSTIIPW